MLDQITWKGRKPLILAPMVEYSHLPFRIMARRYGADLTVTPMIHSKMYQQPKYRQKFQLSDKTIAQICGNNVEDVLATCRLLEPYVSGIDLNLGCPQGIAARGNYGAFLMESPTKVSEIVKAMSSHISVPISCKVRVFDDYSSSLKWCNLLVDSGAKTITVHGRTRKQRGQNSGLADWNQIKRLKEELDVPVISNGNILYSSDITESFNYTNCDGLMIAETSLYHPGIFSGKIKPVWDFAREYLETCYEYSPDTSIGTQRGHIFKFFRHFCRLDNDLSIKLSKSRDLIPIIDEWEDRIRSRHENIVEEAFDYDFPVDHTGYRQIPIYLSQPYIRNPSLGAYVPTVSP
eukprot:NODE_300_length_10433_cov_0.716470.p5 type:complete len:348 gc:universal NODE_300_length_10433_cov_0.716470:8455-9498(+)